MTHNPSGKIKCCEIRSRVKLKIPSKAGVRWKIKIKITKIKIKFNFLSDFSILNFKLQF